MKVTCDNCGKALKVREDMAGKKVRCPACKEPVKIPTSEGASGSDRAALDLDSLESLETEGEALVYERKKKMTLKEAQAAATATEERPKAEKLDPFIRTCPQCRQKVRVPDQYAEVLCRHCGTGIPPVSQGPREIVGYKAIDTSSKFQESFYGGFMRAFLYPLPAIGSIGAGLGIAFGVIALPVTAVVLFQSAAGQNTAVEEDVNLAWVGYFISAMFALEVIYFGSVAYYALIDAIRTTTNGSDQPPPLTWAPAKLISAMGGYGALLGFYAVIILTLLLTSGAGIPPAGDDLQVLTRPVSLIVLALMTFGVPMNMIGLASSESTDGLNPRKIGTSIIQVIGHYFFLFVIFLIYLGLYAGLMYGVIGLAKPLIMRAAQEGMGEEGVGKGITNMLIGLGAWAGVMGLGFYFAYSIGRILGLFGRTYKERLEFEL